MKRFKRALIVTLSVAAAIGWAGLQYAPSAAADASTDAAKNAACAGIGGADSSGNCTTSGPSINNTLKVVINSLSVLVGVAAVVMIMVGGFKYVTSSGDSGKITSAKNTIIFAAVGLVVVALAQVIVHFVLHTTTTVPK